MTNTMSMLPNDHHPGPRCSCRDCQRRYPQLSDDSPAQVPSKDGVSQAPEPTSYVVEGNSYRELIAQRDAYKRVANDLARQLRERTPADTNAPPERASHEPPVVQLEGECHSCNAWVVLRSDTTEAHYEPASSPPPGLRQGLERAIEIISAIEAPSEYYEPFKTRLIDAIQDGRLLHLNEGSE